MNDRFKFRIWDKEFNKYWTDEEIKENAAWLLFPDNDNIENIEIEQCTGLKDKNDRLAYENDIVVFPEMGSKCEYRIVWSDLICGFGFKCNEDSIAPISLETMKRSEIIGNIHENKELLNG